VAYFSKRYNKKNHAKKISRVIFTETTIAKHDFFILYEEKAIEKEREGDLERKYFLNDLLGSMSPQDKIAEKRRLLYIIGFQILF